MKKTLYLLFGLLMSLQVVMAQKAVSGTVTGGDTGGPLVGASIAVKGTTQGTFADTDGKFTINLPVDNDVLVISFIGYEAKGIVVGNQSSIDVTLTVGNELEEVVVIGYTSQRKEDLTGSVAVVEMKPIKNNSSGNVMQAMQGRVPGLYIEKDGSPNGSNSRILIRGGQHFRE